MNRRLAALGATVVTAGALAAGLAAGSAPPAAPARVASIPDAPRAADASDEIALGDSFDLGGLTTRLSMFWTPDETDVVLRTYRDAWRDAGEPLERTIDRVTSLTVLERETGMMRSVQVSDLGDMRLVVPNLVDARRLPAPSSPEDSPVPVPENTASYLSQEVDEPRGRSHHATYVAPMKPATAIEFYRQELTPLGYSERPALFQTGRHGAGRQFVRGPETVEVMATPTDNEGTSCFVVVEHLRAPPATGDDR
ncbi:MAG: hypothetical protein RL199_469 [Pseudomonadota bacterium]